jgi:hypothetical protein
MIGIISVWRKIHGEAKLSSSNFIIGNPDAI